MRFRLQGDPFALLEGVHARLAQFLVLGGFERSTAGMLVGKHAILMRRRGG
jgi:hypothetical protein